MNVICFNLQTPPPSNQSRVDKIQLATLPPSNQRFNLPTDPPVESWQNSYIPSNTGQSSPTLTVQKRKKNFKNGNRFLWKIISMKNLEYLNMFLRMLTYISASVCCNRTYCLVGCCVKTLCSRHCEILSFLLELLCGVSKMFAQQQKYASNY